MQGVVLCANSYSWQVASEAQSYLRKRGIDAELENIDNGWYPDGSRFVKLGPKVRGSNVFVIHNTIVGRPDQANYDLFLIADALKRANDQGFTACPTYFVSRGDKRDEGSVPIPAKLYADLLQTAGGVKLQKVITIHVHADQVEGFFDISCDNVPTLSLFGWYIKNMLFKEYFDHGMQANNLVVLAPDKGSTNLARKAAAYLRLPLCLRPKVRTEFQDRQGEVTTEDVQLSHKIQGRDVLIFDDILDTGTTLVQASDDLVERYGARSVWLFPTHLVLSPKVVSGLPDEAEEKIAQARSKPRVVTTNSIFRDQAYLSRLPWLHAVLSVGPLIGESIYRQVTAQSVCDLYKHPEEFESLLGEFADFNSKL